MKKGLSIVLVLILLLTLAGCGGNKEEGASTETSANDSSVSKKNDVEQTDEKEKVTLDIYQFKVEVVEQLDAFARDFEAEYPYITVNVDTVGGGQKYTDALKTVMYSGNEPDIFNVGGPTEVEAWRDFLEPLTDQPWVKNAYEGTLDTLTIDGEVYGQPYNLEGYGLIYNKAIFEKAGIDPSSITTLSSLENAFKTLEAKKDELGIEHALSFSVGDSAWWTAAIHNLNIPFAAQEDPYAFIEGLKNGTESMVGNDRFEAYVNLLDLFFEYSYDDLLTVSYDDQVANFALGKTAVLHQGNWTIGMIQEIDPELDIAFLPLPISDDANWKNDYIAVGVPNYWVVNSHADENTKEAAKLFLDYIASSERGAKYLVEDCQFIPAFKNITIQPKDGLSTSILEYSAKGKTMPWLWAYYPTGYYNEPGKELIQLYYAKEISRQEFLQRLTDEFYRLANQ